MLASSVMREARRAGIGAEAITAVGSLRRYAPDIGDVSLLGVVPIARQRQVMKAFTRLPLVLDVKSESDTSVVAGTERGPVTLHLTTPEQAGAALVWYTGARAHVDQLQARASRLGLRFDGGAVSRTDGAEVSCASEDELYARLELPFIAPELRSGDGEVGA